MSPSPSRRLLAVLGVVGSVVALLGTGRGQPPDGAARRGGVKPDLTRSFIRANDCARCHRPGGEGFQGEADQPRLVRLDESVVWDKVDKHRRAFDALTGPRGARMLRLLGDPDAKRATSCLTCHGSGFLKVDPEDVKAEAVKDVAQGVNCASCHGMYVEWVENHGITARQSRVWRSKTPEEKTRDFGMTDLRDPATRAGVCFSCHVGNAAEGKVLTHAMYAAGHPPLPGVEVATFLEAMPPHWDPPSKVEAFQKDEGFRKRNHIDLAESPRTRATVIGGVVALRDAMRLLAEETRVEAGPNEDAGVEPWPSYTPFECYACHHDLKAPGYRAWRQARAGGDGFGDATRPVKPGRPRLRPWPLALVPLALAQAGAFQGGAEVRTALRDGVAALQTALEAEPFGQPAKVAEAAGRVEKAADTLLGILAKTRFTPNVARPLVESLTRLPGEFFRDFDTARQVVWAVRTIYHENRAEFGGDQADAIASVFNELDAALKLDPYEARLAPGAAADADRVAASEKEIRRALDCAANFDPDAFMAKLSRLGTLMNRPGPEPLPR